MKLEFFVCKGGATILLSERQKRRSCAMCYLNTLAQDAMIVQYVYNFVTGVQPPQHTKPFSDILFKLEIEVDILEEFSRA